MNACRVLTLLVGSTLLLPHLPGQAPSAPKRKTASSRPAKKAPGKKQAPLRVEEVWFRSLTLREKIAQLLVVPFYGENPPVKSRLYRKFANEIGTLRAGGMILVNHSRGGLVQYADPATSATFLNRMQRLARIPLIVGGDFERGASMRLNGPTRFPHSMAFAAARDLESTAQLGAVTARESRALGVHWVFAPVADVNNNPDNPIINIRSFSENPAEVSAHVKAFVDGARRERDHPVLVTVKHFPGHGDTATDTHYGLGKIEAPLERLRKLEFIPFRAAIEAQVDSVMTAHLWVTALDPEQVPATVSKQVLGGILRKELGFDGIITTDAMDMHGLSKEMAPGEASVRAIEAGVDVLLMPPNPAESVRAIAAAVRSGRLTEKRIEESVRRVLAAKASLGLAKSRYVDVKAIASQLALPADQEMAKRVAQGALTLVRNEAKVIPVAATTPVCWFVMNEHERSVLGNRMMEVLAHRQGVTSVLLSPTTDPAVTEQALKNAEACPVYVLAPFAGFRGNGQLSDNHHAFVEKLLALNKPVVMLGMGNPYLVRAYPKVAGFLATFSTVPASEEAAVRAVFGEIPTPGRMPVTIPGIAAYGRGGEDLRDAQ